MKYSIETNDCNSSWVTGMNGFKYINTSVTEQERIYRICREYNLIQSDCFCLLKCWVVFALYNSDEKFMITKITDSRSEYKYVILSEYADGVVKIKIKKKYDYRVYPFKLLSVDYDFDSFQVLSEFQSEMPDYSLIQYAIRLYEEWPCKSQNLFPNNDMKQKNIDALKELMKRDEAYWRIKDILFFEDYKAVITTDEERVRIWKTLLKAHRSYVSPEKVDICHALSNSDRSMLLLRVGIVTSCTRQDNDPNDYVYELLSPDSDGFIRVWFVNGEVDIKHRTVDGSEKEITYMIKYHELYYHILESALNETYGTSDYKSAIEKAKLTV